MTTIAYKDGVMASDGRIVQGDTILYEDYPKIALIESDTDSYLIGFAGTLGQLSFLHEWARQDFQQDERPRKGTGECALDDIAAIIIKKSDREVLLFEQDGMIHLGHRHVAIGTGQDAAQAALILGLNSVEAVRLASKIDVNTNDNVFCVNLEEAFG